MPLFTSEAVSSGHPDKIADRISDLVVDLYLEKDPNAHIAAESLVTKGLIFLCGEIKANQVVEVEPALRATLHQLGYGDPQWGFDADQVALITAFHPQSKDIAQGIEENKVLHKGMGAGDQGFVFGYACDETEELMPLAPTLAMRLLSTLEEKRHAGLAPFLGPDAKSQITLKYDDAGFPKTISTVLLSSQHSSEADFAMISEFLTAHIHSTLPAERITKETQILINPTGRFVLGGPAADTGLTGRKPIVDTYGGMARHGGGAFSGKDPSKIDRAAAYAARHIAKNIVAANLAKRCEIQISYAIGIEEPISLTVDTFQTGIVDDDILTQWVRELFDLRPKALIEQLKLRRPIYQKTSSGGHFGRTEPEFTWEKRNRVDDLQKYAQKQKAL